MKTLTLEEAVTEVIQDFVSNNRGFSAHEVTTAIRNKVNAQEWEISGIPFGYVDASNTHSQSITHSDVRDLVRITADALKLDTQFSAGHRVYCTISNAGITGVTSATGPFSMPSNTPAAVTFVGNGAPAASIGLFTQPPVSAPGSVAVPQRFTVTVKDEIKQKITRYVRNKLNLGEDVNLHMVQKTIKSGMKLPEIEKIIRAEGWNLNPVASNPARSLWMIS